ncbi:MAG: protein-glutamate O-methyltransferase CheR [Desulfonatronovibrio sp.]
MSFFGSQSLSLRKTAPLSDKEFDDLRDLIYKVAGIDIPKQRRYLLENRLRGRLNELNLKNFSEYYQYLRYGADKRNELEYFCEKMTTNETSFFRDPKQLGVFRVYVLIPLLEKLKTMGRKRLHIWSAGCSSGEEAYTLGIMLHEILKTSIISWNIRITANDISSTMLEKARQGLYNEHSLRNTPKDVVQSYFSKEPGGFKIDPKIQKIIKFEKLNLNDSAAIKRIPRSEIVFCRNVIIYFDEAMKKKVVNSFYDNLIPKGFLVMGHSESLHSVTRVFNPIRKPGGIVYQKTE